jgi:hypothetical protein
MAAQVVVALEMLGWQAKWWNWKHPVHFTSQGIKVATGGACETNLSVKVVAAEVVRQIRLGGNVNKRKGGAWWCW